MDQVELADAERTILNALPCDTAVLTQMAAGRFKERVVSQAFRNLIRGGQMQELDGRFELTFGSEDRAEFRKAALAALTPVLERWTILTDREQRQELIYAVEGRLRQNRKRCPGCRQALLREAFGMNASRSDGLHPICRACRKERK